MKTCHIVGPETLSIRWGITSFRLFEIASATCLLLSFKTEFLLDIFNLRTSLKESTSSMLLDNNLFKREVDTGK